MALSLAEIGTGIPNPELRRRDDFRVSLKLDFELLKVPDALFNLFIEENKIYNKLYEIFIKIRYHTLVLDQT